MLDATADQDFLHHLSTDSVEAFDAKGRTISAPLIRRALLGNLEGADGKSLPPRTVHIKGAVFNAPLQLQDCECPGGAPLPTLALEQCMFHGIDISHAHLLRLSLRQSKFTTLDGRGCRIVGDLDISSVRSSGFETGAALPDQGPQPLCHVKLRGARIGGSIIATSAQLVAPKPRQDFDPNSFPAEYAFNLAAARVTGNIYFNENARAVGGVNLPTEVTGDVLMSGAELFGLEGNALNGQLAKINGFVALRAHNSGGGNWRAFTARKLLGGTSVSFLQADIRGTLDLTDAKIEGDLSLRDLTCQGHLMIGGLESNSILDLRNVKAGSVFAIGVRAHHILAENMCVNGDLTFTGELLGPVAPINPITPISLERANINGNLDIGYVKFGFDAPSALASLADDAVAPSILLDDAVVKGRLNIANVEGEAPPLVEDLKNGRNLIAARACSLPWLREAQLVEIAVRTATHGPVQIALVLSENHPQFLYQTGRPIHRVNQNQHFKISDAHAVPYLQFFCAYIVGNDGPFEIVNPKAPPPDTDPDALARVQKPTLTLEKDGVYRGHGTVHYAGHLFNSTFEVGPTGNVEMLDDDPLGTASKEEFVLLTSSGPLAKKLPANITASQWLGERRRTGHPGKMKELAADKARDILRKAAALLETHVISLTNASIGTLSDKSVPTTKGVSVRLKLSGLSLTRTDWSPPQAADNAPAPKPKESATGEFDRSATASNKDWYREWLTRKIDGRVVDPQPYEELIRVYQARGDIETASDITKLRHAALETNRSGTYRVMSRVWHGLFGLGLSWVPPLATVVASLFLVYAATIAADATGALQGPADDNPSTSRFIFSGSAAKASQQCGLFNSFAFAVERFVPLIDLREQRCVIAEGAWSWRALFLTITILGWIIVPLAIYSITRAVRMQFERSIK